MTHDVRVPGRLTTKLDRQAGLGSRIATPALNQDIRRQQRQELKRVELASCKAYRLSNYYNSSFLIYQP